MARLHPPPGDATIGLPMFKSLVRTLKGPSRDPRMAHISRPLPRGLQDEQVLAALEVALGRDPDPAYLVETLPDALHEVTGRTYEVLDRSTRDVTGTYAKTMVMIREGSVGLWPGYAARAYPLLARDARHEETRAAIAEADGAATPGRKAGWEPPPPASRAPAPVEVPIGTATGGASAVQDAGPQDHA
jgi:hypothetical protein